MQAVWSFWSKPFRSSSPFWTSGLHHLFSWVVSFETARNHYPKTALFTDDEGARLLIDGIGLGFEFVSTELNALAGQDPGWWALGKLYAYRAMREPFVHLDSDVFLWKPLPERLIGAPVFAQNPEPINGFWYNPEAFERVLLPIENGWVPTEWSWYRSASVGQRAECCGILGGNRIDFINHYARTGIRFLEEPSNQPGWASLEGKEGHNILFEQYLLAACVDYHRSTPGSPYRDISIAYLFNHHGDAFDEDQAERVGYTHLMGAKRSGELAYRLEKRVRRDFPDYHQRCRKLAEKLGYVF